MVFWELLEYDEDKKGGFYRIKDNIETNDMDPRVPEFKTQKPGDIILGHKDTGLEAYVVD